MSDQAMTPDCEHFYEFRDEARLPTGEAVRLYERHGLWYLYQGSGRIVVVYGQAIGNGTMTLVLGQEVLWSDGRLVVTP